MITPTVGLIDWLTFRIDASLLGHAVREKFLNRSDKMQRISSVTGEIVWETICRETIRSDSHHINVHCGSYFEIMGSPARVLSKNNVFGSLDIIECFNEMISFVCRNCEIFLPRDPKVWSCTRIDVTQNYDLGSIENVLQAIDCLKVTKVGRQKPYHFDTTVGWGKSSSLHKGKVYAKGPHMRKEGKRQKQVISESELNKCDRLLRLEYQICRHLIKRLSDVGKFWHTLSGEFLVERHNEYFSKFISEIEVTDMDNILAVLIDNVGEGENKIPTLGQAQSAYDCYTRVKLMGFQQARSSYPGRTFRRHVKNLKTIGMTEADLQQINVIPLKKRQIVLGNPVSSWDDIKLAI